MTDPLISWRGNHRPEHMRPGAYSPTRARPLTPDDLRRINELPGFVEPPPMPPTPEQRASIARLIAARQHHIAEMGRLTDNMGTPIRTSPKGVWSGG